MPEYRLTRLRGRWAVSIWEDGRRIGRYSLATSDRKEAERILARFVADREKPKHVTVAYAKTATCAPNAGQRKRSRGYSRRPRMGREQWDGAGRG